jgi:hypothetical protein
MLWQLKSENLFRRDFRTTPGKIAYHVPCHLKAQAIGFRSRDLMRTIPGAAITTVDACTAHDGTWAMKKEYFELSLRTGEKAFAGLRDADARVIATDCPLARCRFNRPPAFARCIPSRSSHARMTTPGSRTQCRLRDRSNQHEADHRKRDPGAGRL